MKRVIGIMIGGLAITVAYSQSASFQLVPVLSSQSPASAPQGLNEDGSVVVGYSIDTDGLISAFRASPSGNIQSIGRLEPPGESYAESVSGDGQTVVGYSYNSDSQRVAFYWTEADGMQHIGELPGGRWARAYDVSYDGRVVIGYADDTDAWQAFKWTQDTGVVALEELDGEYTRSQARAVSGDGKTTVGYCTNADGRNEAVYWDENNRIHPLGFLSRGDRSYANVVSYDGEVIAGDGNAWQDDEGYRWTESSGMQGLGMLPGTYSNNINDMTSDGSVIVGETEITSSINTTAFIWDEIQGIRELKEVLINDYGLDLTGWTLKSADAISGNGMTITGIGVNPDGIYQGWIVQLPEPSSFIVILSAAILTTMRRHIAG